MRSPFTWWLLYMVGLPSCQLIISCILTFYHSSILYTVVYASYLAIISDSVAEPLSVTVTRWVFTVILAIRTSFAIGATFYRVRYRALWINQCHTTWPVFLMRFHWYYQAVSHVVAWMTQIPYIATLSITGMWKNSNSVALVGVAVLLTELSVYILQAVIILVLRNFFHFNDLSPFVPFLPISMTMNSTALKRRNREKNRRAIASLPQKVFDQSQFGPGQDLNCSVCLSEFQNGDLMRVLKCQHLYHQGCIDKWLERRTVCPLCVRDVTARTPSNKRRQAQRGSWFFKPPLAAIELGPISAASLST